MPIRRVLTEIVSPNCPVDRDRQSSESSSISNPDVANRRKWQSVAAVDCSDNAPYRALWAQDSQLTASIRTIGCKSV